MQLFTILFLVSALEPTESIFDNLLGKWVCDRECYYEAEDCVIFDDEDPDCKWEDIHNCNHFVQHGKEYCCKRYKVSAIDYAI